VGKANLDQFATGLVGSRSPYGVPRNPFAAAFSPGGSSSGSAVAVAAGLVSFALGTDTAGSGRVPAAFTNIIGLKPTRGLTSTRGVVPACRSLDCVSVFALTMEDATAVFDIAARYDAGDPLARRVETSAAPPPLSGGFRFGVPAAAELEFFGDAEQARLYEAALGALEQLGGVRVEIPFAPFRAAGQMLYSGPWLAERLHTVEGLLARSPDAILPVTRRVLAGGEKITALDAFRGAYVMAALKREVEPVWQAIDALVLPTTGTIYRLAAIAADPIGLNQNLGYYTNFVNLLDLAAVAVPAGFRNDGLPAGVTLMGPAFSDRALAMLAARLHRHLDLPLGATGAAAEPESVAPPALAETRRIPLAVVGAHMSGMALNHELTTLGAIFSARTRTAARYRFFALPGQPARPGLVRLGEGETGAEIEAEIWLLEPAAFGDFVAAVPSPLAIGTLLLADGTSVKGFLCEAAAVAGARDISTFGGWRGFVAAGQSSGATGVG
jgi:allophanate hydrolase